MTFKIKSLVAFMICILILCFSCFGVFAAGEGSVSERLYDRDGGILSVSYRGDTVSYPANSLEGIVSAANIGADMISVSVMKTSDGVLMLCEDKPLMNICNTDKTSLSELTFNEASALTLYQYPTISTQYKMPSLEQALTVCDMGVMLICDIDWSLREEVYDFLLEKGALSKVLIRIKASAGKLVKWVEEKAEKPAVIGLYGANVVFTAISHLEKLSDLGMPVVSYQNKNYFNVMYGNFVGKNYSKGENARAMASFYNLDVSGQREDSQDGWNELIKKGFSVIETNNIASLVSYIEETKSLSFSLFNLYQRTRDIDLSLYNQASVTDIEKSLKEAEKVLAKGYACPDELQSAQSQLIHDIEALSLKTGEDTQRGALNITFGKVIAAILVGGVLLAAQIFVHKMQKGKKESN